MRILSMRFQYCLVLNPTCRNITFDTIVFCWKNTQFYCAPWPYLLKFKFEIILRKKGIYLINLSQIIWKHCHIMSIKFSNNMTVNKIVIAKVFVFFIGPRIRIFLINDLVGDFIDQSSCAFYFMCFLSIFFITRHKIIKKVRTSVFW